MSFSRVKNRLSDFKISSTITRHKTTMVDHVRVANFKIVTLNGGRISGYISADGKYVWALHHEKRRAKFIAGTVRQKHNPRQWQAVKLNDAEWHNSLYKFEITQIVSFRQLDRHFEVVLK